MAAARTAVRGLSDDDLQTIRGTLAAGRKPKVMFTEAAGQISGQLGQVVQLTDPAHSDEWVVVRFGRDELPFSPGDLRLPPRGAATARKPEPKPEPAPELLVTRRPVPAPREETTVTPKAVSPAAKSAPSAARTAPTATKATPGAAKAAPPSTPPPAAATAPEPPAAAEPPAEAKPARRPARAAKPKAPASLTVTLAYTEGEWTVGATQGSKALAKPYLIKPAEALKMVGMLDVPGVHEAVEQIVAAERAEAEAQADKLRTELAEIEARLAELRAAG
jgi:hypothetical protein